MELDIEPHYNAAPTLQLPVYRIRRSGPELSLMRWGLIPSWSKDKTVGARLINARADTLASKPSFATAFHRRRCLIPASGFYEWKNVGPAGGNRKAPYFIRLLNEETFAFAGLWEYWRSDAEDPILSFTIITCEPNEMMAELHNRMPVILSRERYEDWVDPQNRDTAALQAMLAPYPADEMQAYPVSPRVNVAANDDAELINPLR